MSPAQNTSEDRHRAARPIWTVIPVAAVALLGAGWVIVAGVARKEDCSATVGSIDTGDGLYRPCELVGYLEGVVLVALAALVTMVMIKDGKLRMVVALVAAMLILAIAHFGLDGLAA